MTKIKKFQDSSKKTLQDAYVIYYSSIDEFQGRISFNKGELESECLELNTKMNDDYKKNWELRFKDKVKNPYPHEFMEIYEVLDLETAMERKSDSIRDYYNSKGDGY